MSIIFKIIVGILFIGIFVSLGSALFFLVHDRANSDRIVKALTWRITLSFILFIFLFIAFSLHWISPHSVRIQ